MRRPRLQRSEFLRIQLRAIRSLDRAGYLYRFATFEGAGLSLEFRAAFDRDHERPLDVFFRGYDIADTQSDEVGCRNRRVGKIDNEFHERVAQSAADSLDIFRGRRFLPIAHPAIRRQSPTNAFDRVE